MLERLRLVLCVMLGLVSLGAVDNRVSTVNNSAEMSESSAVDNLANNSSKVWVLTKFKNFCDISPNSIRRFN